VIWIDAHSVNAVPSTGGSISVLATTLQVPVSVLISGANVLWTESSGAVHGETGVLNSVPITGGAVSTLYSGGTAPQQLAVDSASQIYWTEGGQVGLNEGFARIARLSAGNVADTVVAGLNAEAARFVATATDLYVADQWQIKRVPLSGGYPHIVASSDGPIAFLTADNTRVYWTNANDASVHSALMTGGSTLTVVTGATLGGEATPFGNIRVSPGGALVWGVADPTHRRILSVPSDSATAATAVLADVPDYAQDIWVDAQYAYFGPTGIEMISKVPLSGGALIPIASMNNPPDSIVLDGSTLYWLTGQGISKVPVSGGPGSSVLIFTGNNGNISRHLAVGATNVFWTDIAAQQIRTSTK
jgi:hypothetical protein